MADWFADLVDRMSAEVIASSDTADKLALTDRVTQYGLRAATAGPNSGLRAQFAADIGVIQGIDAEIEHAERKLLTPEFDAVTAAADRLATAQREPTTPPPGRLDRLRHRLHLDGAAPDTVPAARARLRTSQDALKTARQAKGIAQLDTVREPASRRAAAVAKLAEDLRTALTIRVNAVIDRELEESYERLFSYSGEAELGDPLALTAQPVDTEAFRRLAYLIKDVGSGTIGVAGPRGSGKSTLLRQFATTVTDSGRTTRWGLYVPAPAKYDARDFLLYLLARLCAEVLGPARTHDVEKRLSTSASAAARRAIVSPGDVAVVTAMALTCWGLVLGLEAAGLHESSARMTDLLIACCCAIVCLISVTALFLVGQRLAITPPGVFATVRGSTTLSKPMRAVLLPLAGLTVTTAVVLFALLQLGVAPQPAYLAASGLGLAGVAVVMLLAYLRPKGIHLGSDELTSQRWFPEPLDDYAAQWYAKAKFQQTFTTGWSGTLTVGPAAVQAQGGLSGGSEVTALAMPIPEIVEQIKEFITRLAGSRTFQPRPTPVVIGIDEIDKIDDPADAQAFFNQIKGLFGDTSAVFLVSISDDAMAAFERRGLPLRDAFDSSLSSVVTLSCLTRAEARTLIGSRLLGVQEPVADLLYVLSGGLARDLVRLIRRAVEARQAGLDTLTLALISSEVEAKRKAVLARARMLEPCPARNDLLKWAGKHPDEPAATPDPASYYAGLLTDAAPLVAAGCGTGQPLPGGQAPTDPDSCTASEIGMFLTWIGTTGQVFAGTASRADFQAGESPAGARSFERLAQAKQDFPLGASYVLSAITTFRDAWQLRP